MLFRAAFAFAGCLILAAPAFAQADKPQAVVLTFTGANAALARRHVIRGVRGQVRLKPNRAAQAAARSAGAKAVSTKGRRAIARKLKLDLVIWGRVRGKGSTARTVIRVAGRDGKVLATGQTVRPGTQKNNNKIMQAARRAVRRALNKTGGASKKESAGAARGKRDAKPTITVTAGDPEPVQRRQDKPPKRKKSKAAKGDTPIFVALVGAGGRSREIKVSIDDGSVEGGRRRYSSELFLELVTQLEVRPAARSEKKGLRGIYMQVDLGLDIGLSSAAPVDPADPMGPTTTLDTTMLRFLGQAGYLASIGSKLEVGGTLAFGWDQFTIDENAIMPSVRYLLVRAGLVGRYYLIPEALYARLDFGFRYPFFTGDLTQAFGRGGGALGFDLGLTLGGQHKSGFTYAARFDWTRYKLSFSGATNANVLANATGTGGSDRAISFSALAGWSFK